jgi:hypothetical protein
MLKNGIDTGNGIGTCTGTVTGTRIGTLKGTNSEKSLLCFQFLGSIIPSRLRRTNAPIRG